MNSIYLNPEQEISKILSYNGYGENLELAHIKYDQSTNDDYQYQIIRDSTHDGTFLFTKELIDKALFSLIRKESYCKSTISKEELKNLKDVNYTIGDIKIQSEYIDDYKFGTSVKDVVTIPVKIEYIFN